MTLREFFDNFPIKQKPIIEKLGISQNHAKRIINGDAPKERDFIKAKQAIEELVAQMARIKIIDKPGKVYYVSKKKRS